MLERPSKVGAENSRFHLSFAINSSISKKGSVIVKPKSSIKANPIIVKFSGAIFMSVKDKEVIPLFQTSKTLPINDGKSKVLEAKTYSFPFEFVVPDNLPSAMDVSKPCNKSSP